MTISEYILDPAVDLDDVVAYGARWGECVSRNNASEFEFYRRIWVNTQAINVSLLVDSVRGFAVIRCTDEARLFESRSCKSLRFYRSIR